MPSDILFLSSHFFRSLEEHGPESVLHWTSSKRKNVDIFTKRLIFIVINKDIHWSLVVLVNPGRIFSDQNETNSFMFHFDSLSAHNSTHISNTLYQWLNSEANRRNEGELDVFNDLNMPVCIPDAPRQENSWDCGAFVCYYFFSMMSLSNSYFSAKKRAFTNKRKASKLMGEWITKQDPFQFGMKDIFQLRKQLAILVSDLSDASPKEEQLEELASLSVKELKGKCKEYGLKPGNRRKEALIQMLNEI